jgi:hypothetical protein
MKILPFLNLALIPVVFNGCTVKNPSSEEAYKPTIVKITVSDTLYLGTRSGYPVSVQVHDPQGSNDIIRVTCYVVSNDPVSSTNLLDDGLNGDIIPQDGVFYGRLKPASFDSLPGPYRIDLTAEDMEGHVAEMSGVGVVMVHGGQNGGPVLFDPMAPDTVKTDAVASVFFSVRVFDADGAGDIKDVLVNFQPSWIPGLVDPVALRDDGTGGDVLARDGIYSITADMRNSATSAGTYLARFEAWDSKGQNSSPLVVPTVVAGVNDPPVLSDLTAPSTVSRQSSLPMLLTVRVSDPQGPADIRRVYFNTTKPDGTPSAGNPFLMFDDGASGMHGDTAAGDGVYSLAIYITPDSKLGIYRFEFFAEDMSRAQARPLVHMITVEDIQ